MVSKTYFLIGDIPMTNTATRQIIEAGIDGIENLKGQDVEASELHHHLYNEDYFIIGTYQATQFLNEYGSFDAIGEVQKYENENFGDVTTDLSDPEKVANMLAYIKGEEALYDCPTLMDKWNDKLTDEDLDTIKAELSAKL
jgi:hypothetical protein